MSPALIASIFAICCAAFAGAALVILALNPGPSKPLKVRLDALTWKAVPAQFADTAPDIRREEKFSGIGWLNRWILRLDLAPKIRLLLYQADVKTPAETLLVTSLGGWAAVAFLLALRTGRLAPSVILAAPVASLPLLYLLRMRSVRFAKFEQQFPEALDSLVGALKVGHSLITGIGALGEEAPEPVAREFRKLFDEQNFGIDLRIAMASLTTRVPLQDVRIFVAAALIQKESGGNLAEVLEKVAQTTRERFQLKKQIQVHTAQGRLTGWILSLLPLVLGFGMYLLNPTGMSVLWTRPAGLKMLYTAIGMIVVGCLMIRKIVRIRV